jgi:hypothetical protein
MKARSDDHLYHPAAAEIRIPKAVRRGIIERDITLLIKKRGDFFCITFVFK